MTEKAPQAYRCALAFACQLAAKVPVEPHDALVQHIITEKESFTITQR